MPQYTATATIALDTIDITATVTADTFADAEQKLLARIEAGEFNADIDQASAGHSFEVLSVEVS